jgi:hypothetical protein
MLIIHVMVPSCDIKFSSVAFRGMMPGIKDRGKEQCSDEIRVTG